MKDLVKGLIYTVTVTGTIFVGVIGAMNLIDRDLRKAKEKNFPKANKLEIFSKDLMKNDSTETILHDKTKNQYYLVKYDSTGKLNLVPYEGRIK